MRKLIIIAGGILLLINQGAVINSQEFRASIKNTEIIVKQGDILKIAKAERINTIVHPTNFYVDSDTEIAQALKKADLQWYSNAQQGISDEQRNRIRNGSVRSTITHTFSLRDQGVSYIVNTIGPKGDDAKWKENLSSAYRSSIRGVGFCKTESIAFPPISTGTDSLNADGRVTITPSEEAKIALAAIVEYFKQKPDTSIKRIFFISRTEDGPVHFLTYKKLLKGLSDNEEKKLSTSEYEYILELEKKTRFKEYIRYKLTQWRAVLSVGMLAVLASLYVLKKSLSSQ